MSNRPLRFVHASDLHLEQPASGISEVPEHLREVLVEAPFWAAERLFETVLAEEADLLVLSGDVIDPARSGPYGPLFLVSQFERLAARKIEVYWAGGRSDPPAAWPAFAPLPPNVHVFSCDRLEQFLHDRDGSPAVRLTGVSRAELKAEGGKREAKAESGKRKADRSSFIPHPSSFPAFPPDGPFSIAVVYGKIDPETLAGRGIDFWALGGNHARSTPASAPHAAHWPGSPQGRRPDEPGPHGCSLVQVDDERHARITLIPCDVLRWHTEQVTVDPAAGAKDLERRLHDRMKALREAAPGIDLMVSFSIVAGGRLAGELRQGTLAAQLLRDLRTDYGLTEPAVWTVSLSAEAATTLPAQWYEQDTIRGDFLREVRRLQTAGTEPIRLDDHLPEALRVGPLGRTAILDDAARRQEVLREAAALGAELLSGEDRRP
jgi:DNA repair protein SbcD/Mre11